MRRGVLPNDAGRCPPDATISQGLELVGAEVVGHGVVKGGADGEDSLFDEKHLI
jgi:hypothetical protein